ncbi:TRAP transporter substrate-binding protein DctP [Desulfococcaceae bacterium HSG9]|nr:TRAP transporter substrate-binding protein DctP [Desulfococcaceae bacterium HSG9]
MEKQFRSNAQKNQINKRKICNKTSFYCLSFILILALFTSLSATQAIAKSVIKVAFIGSDDPYVSVDGATAVVFKNLVETGTNNEIEVRLFPGGVLGQEREMMEMLKGGLIHVHLATAGSMGSFFPLYGVFDIPYLIPSYSVAYDVWDGWYGKKVDDLIFAKTGLRSLGFFAQSGFYHLTNNKKMIKNIKDMKGLKFRTMTLPSHIKIFEAMGASAIPISWAELYTSLQTGVIDGQHNPVGYIVQGKLQEVQKYMTLTGHMYAVGFFLVNDKWFQSLSPEFKNVVLDASRVAKTAARGMNSLVNADKKKGIPFLKKDMEIYKPTPAEIEEFAAATIPAMRKYITETLGQEGVDLLNDYVKAVEESKKKLSYAP